MADDFFGRFAAIVGGPAAGADAATPATAVPTPPPAPGRAAGHVQTSPGLVSGLPPLPSTLDGWLQSPWTVAALVVLIFLLFILAL
jgi:hypothetical protein